ncbi:MAG: hypothetical protein GQ544_00790 [Candidatus Aminicenantes bacterium]|nr:hypothetical protein [Candidatus Aminicenantes bacterium]
MLKKQRYAILFTIVLLLVFRSLPAEQVSKWEWQGVERVVAIGDVHGEYDKLVQLLTGLGLTDNALTWTGGEAHLVLCGDLLDRGKKERAVMDLLMRLQQEAKKQGGEVHTLLGNHDVMNLVYDFRYVDKANYADFIKEEKARDRKRGYGGFKQLYSGEKLKESQLKAAFDEKYPLGYFGRRQAFELRGQYGKWLIQHPTLIKINDVVYVHAGLREDIAAVGIDKTNQEVQKSIKSFIRYSKILEPFIKGPAEFDEFYAAAKAIMQQSSSGQIPGNLADASQGLLRETERYVFSPQGPFWYRGNSQEKEGLEWFHIKESLKQLDVKTIVVAHTPTQSKKINERFGGALYRTDVGMVYKRDPLALEFSDNNRRIFNPKTSSFEKPFKEEPWGEGISDVLEQLPEPQMKDFLLNAAIVEAVKEERDSRQYRVVELEKDHNRRRAFHLSVAEKQPSDQAGRSAGYRHYKHEYAAYLLDRELELGFVPITVLREVDGQLGTLQEWPEKVYNLPTLLRGGGSIDFQDIFDDEAFRNQVSQIRLFWALLDVRDNHDALKMWLPAEKRVMAGDNTIAFSLSPDIQEELLYFKEHPNLIIKEEYKGRFTLNPSFDIALRTLDLAGLEELLGYYISKEEIKALLLRRDKLLELCSPEYQDEENSNNSH